LPSEPVVTGTRGREREEPHHTHREETPPEGVGREISAWGERSHNA